MVIVNNYLLYNLIKLTYFNIYNNTIKIIQKKIALIEKLDNKDTYKENSVLKHNKQLDVELEQRKLELKSVNYVKQTNNRIIDQTRNDIINLKKQLFELEKSNKVFTGLIKREEYTTSLVKAKTNKIFNQKVNAENKTDLNKVQHESDIDYYNVVIEKKKNFLKVK